MTYCGGDSVVRLAKVFRRARGEGCCVEESDTRPAARQRRARHIRTSYSNGLVWRGLNGQWRRADNRRACVSTGAHLAAHRSGHGRLRARLTTMPMGSTGARLGLGQRRVFSEARKPYRRRVTRHGMAGRPVPIALAEGSGAVMRALAAMRTTAVARIVIKRDFARFGPVPISKFAARGIERDLLLDAAKRARPN